MNTGKNNSIEVKDDSHKDCREFLKDKKCQFCEKLFDDLINKKGIYDDLENPPSIEKSDKEEFISNAQGFARTYYLCGKHFRIFRKDNKKLNEKGIEIPRELTLTKLRRSDI